jgi:hypothetical protein
MLKITQDANLHFLECEKVRDGCPSSRKSDGFAATKRTIEEEVI